MSLRHTNSQDLFQVVMRMARIQMDAKRTLMAMMQCAPAHMQISDAKDLHLQVPVVHSWGELQKSLRSLTQQCVRKRRSISTVCSFFALSCKLKLFSCL